MTSCWRLVNCHLLLLLLFVPITIKSDGEMDDSDILPDIRYLYEEPVHVLDPDDMLQDFNAMRRARKGQDSTANLHNNLAPPAVERSVCSSKDKDELHSCKEQLELLSKRLQAESTVNEKLQKKIPVEEKVDYQPFYHRTLSLLWKSLQLETGLSSATSGNVVSVTRQLSLTTSTAVLTTLHNCLLAAPHATAPLHQCDEAVSSLLLDLTVQPDEPAWTARLLLLLSDWPALLTIDVALNCLAVLMLWLLIWFAALLISDVRRSRRWVSFLTLMLLLAFPFCCLWTWRNMIREVEARRAAEWELRSSDGHELPAECRQRGIWSWLWGSEEKCKRYFSDAFISAFKEVTPETVISTTIVNFFIKPLGALGRELGHFFREFYATVPLLYLMPASMMLLVLLLVLLLMLCGYSLHLPLFMGSIRPAPRDPAPALDQHYAAVTRQLKEEQQVFLQESRRMLLDINAATTASAQRAQMVQPILASSYQSIESQLERLINSRLQAIVEAPAKTTGETVTGLTPLAVTREASVQDQTDGASASTEPVPAAAADRGVIVEDTNEFYEDVCSVLGESLNCSTVSQAEESEAARPRRTTPPRHQAVRHPDAPLSPASKRFLSQVKTAMES